VAVVDEQIRRIQTKIDTLTGTRNARAAALQKLSRTSVDEDIANEEAVRLAGLTRRTQRTMREFLNRATEAKIDRLSVLVTESFRFLLRKRSFIQNIHIDPATFAITLYDSSGNAIPKHRLSEGEKQTFAVSVLWGLARASRRSLPAIIDTPMGRLDRTHRKHLVQRYFPNASHQVIVLSTDTEVDRQYYADLQPHIARAFHLNYSEKKKSTVGEEGYFWATEETATVS
jgi:DNA sulfur modification protein DndD